MSRTLDGRVSDQGNLFIDQTRVQAADLHLYKGMRVSIIPNCWRVSASAVDSWQGMAHAAGIIVTNLKREEV